MLVGVFLAGGVGCGRGHVRHTRTRESVARQLGCYLADQFPGARALILSNPFTRSEKCPDMVRRFEQAALKGLKAGFGGRITTAAVVYPELRPGAERRPLAMVRFPTPTPLSYLMAPGQLTRVAGEHADCRLIVSLIGIPAGLPGEPLWQWGDRVSLAFLLPDFQVLDRPELVREAFASGLFAAAVVEQSGEDGTQRFQLVTPQNVDRILSRMAFSGYQ
ncbi:MAG TPA: hypothetical protein EYP62_07615 [Kiritimatiellae bacterium]|nr:hypothetical protein [Kiritimatiellia bacterium]